MVGFILSGHECFASGLHSSLTLISGAPEYYQYVDFLQNMTQESLLEKFKEARAALVDCDEVVVMTDIMGGTPFKTAVMLSFEDESIQVISGTNLPLLLTMSLSRTDDSTALSLIEQCIDESRNALFHFNKAEYM